MNQTDYLQEVMSIGEAAKVYGIHRQTIRDAIFDGSIPARKSGDVWLICRSDAQVRWGGPGGNPEDLEWTLWEVIPRADPTDHSDWIFITGSDSYTTANDLKWKYKHAHPDKDFRTKRRQSTAP